MTEVQQAAWEDHPKSDMQMQMHIDLSALVARMQYRLMMASRLVAIGLHSAANIDHQSFILPDTPIVHDFGSGMAWPIERAQSAWRLWILQNGFRDVAETISEILEGAHEVLSLWALLDTQKSGRRLNSKDWHDMVVRAGQRFHKFNLPTKIEHLQSTFGFSIDDGVVRQIMSINAARNCLVHRNGIIGVTDVQEKAHFELHWCALVTLAIKDDTEVEFVPPYFVEAGATVAVAVRPRVKKFPFGATLEVTAIEFAEICWTLLSFAQSTAKELESNARARGVIPPESKRI